jgi:hypothetical protein
MNLDGWLPSPTKSSQFVDTRCRYVGNRTAFSLTFRWTKSVEIVATHPALGAVQCAISRFGTASIFKKLMASWSEPDS